VIFACSGAADVGEIADRAARKLAQDGVGSMGCLSALNRRDGAILQTAMSASKILVIDGCPEECARRSVEQAGLRRFDHLQLRLLSMVRGRSPATTARVRAVVRWGRQMLADGYSQADDWSASRSFSPTTLAGGVGEGVGLPARVSPPVAAGQGVRAA